MFGVSVGTERIGLYTSSDVRGFNPVTAGNRRVEGLYIDISGPGMTHNRALTGNVVRVGLPALAYPFPAPTGIVDYTLRTSNDRQGLSLGLARHPYGGGMVELDAQSPVVAGVLSVAAGAMYSSDRTVEDAVGGFHAFFLSPKFNFGSGELTAFWAHGDSRQETRPLVVTPGALLPPDLGPGDFYGQRWAISQVRQNVVGLLGRYEISEHLTLRGGLFDARTVRPESATPIFVDVQPDGSARELVAADGELRGRWTSGEVRLAYERKMGAINHALIASVRGRDRFLTNGETPPVDLGIGTIGVYREKPKPEIAGHGSCGRFEHL